MTGREVSNQNNDGESIHTDAEGNFELPPQNGDYSLVAASDAGFALIQNTDFTNSPYTYVEAVGTHRRHVFKKWSSSRLARNYYFFAGDVIAKRNVWSQQPVPKDAAGAFVFAHVPPGTIRIELKQPMAANSWTYLELATTNVEAGGTNRVQINLEGRPVTGHLQRSADLTNDVDFTQFQISLQPDVRGTESA